MSEIQHGTVGKYHIGYNYPPKTNIHFFPDKFISWGNYWIEKTRFPDGCNVKLSGFPYINNQKQKIIELEKQKQILIISQLSNDIALFAAELSKLTHYKILFKPHPREYSSIESRYGFLTEYNNIEILSNPNVNIYTYFASSEYVLGVSSTALIEALAFNTKVIIAQLPSWEYFIDLKDENVFFANKPEVAAEIVNSDKEYRKFSESQFFVQKSNKEYIKDLYE